ncbi:Na+/H+ antiporter NhaC family protein [Sporosarcina saromensis]|uniref:Na+/H+ antiporter NhaC family protein n=1 Tax=Sporosarcina saromensis TaxID=359365 RepID=A0ABU4G807_9BACL|nr:Na+/H+ antiporter NhaC family protein [Sporosarcina saromensis]MDW0113104.1 Na+/H+ antiporter NhaC family protein [Sporosarcina saromensis]
MEKKKWKLKPPTTTALLMFMIVLVGLLTYIVPAGQYDRVMDEKTGRELIVADSFSYTEQTPVGIGGILSSVFGGIVGAAEIIAFVFIVGGVFGVVVKSGAINAALAKLIARLKGRESLFIIIAMTAFAIGGATFGMAEETLPFVAIVLAATIAMGYDRIIAVSIVVVGVYAGYSAGPLNPFNVGIAQGIAELPLFSGIGLRTVLMIGGLVIAIHHTLRYAKKVKADPKSGLLFGEAAIETDAIVLVNTEMTSQHKWIMAVLGLSLVALVFGVLKYGWYLGEISALMLLMGIIVGMIAFKGSFNQFTDEFMKGAADMTAAALIIGLSRAILVVMEEGHIIDTLVYAVSVPLGSLHSVFAAWGMYLSQGLINFIIPSSTGQAAVVMPIMSSISDVIGINRQIAVQAFQSGDGYWNMITPTHPVLMAALGIAAVPFGKWLRFAGPLVLKWTIWTMIILAVGVMIDWGPY